MSLKTSPKASYNLLEEDWISVVYKSGESKEVSILQLLQDAKNIAAINDAFPMFQLGIYRMLISFVMDALQINSIEKLNGILSNCTEFDMKPIAEYTAQHRDKFDLFSASEPFYQKRAKSAKSDGDAEVGSKKKKSTAKSADATVAYLFQFLPSGTNVIYYGNRSDKEHAVSPAVAARALCNIPAFMTMRGVGYSPSLNGAPPIYLIVIGENLFQTLLLNCSVFEQDHFADPEVGMPLWRSPIPVEKRPIDKASVMFGLTYMPRSVRLIPSEGGICTISGKQSSILIRQMEYGPGFKWVGKWTDPNVAYVTKEKKKIPIRLREGRDIWRDFGPLMFLHEEVTSEDDGGDNAKSQTDETLIAESEAPEVDPKDKSKDKKISALKKKKPALVFERPAVVRQLSYLKFITNHKDLPISFEVYGMMTEKAKIFEWQYEILSVPLQLTLSIPLSKRVQKSIDLADDIGFALKIALKELLNPVSESKSRVSDRDTAMIQALTEYWQSLKPRFEESIIERLSELALTQPTKEKDLSSEISATADTIVTDWIQLVKQIAVRILRETSDRHDTTAHHLQNGSTAFSSFYGFLKYKGLNGDANSESEESKEAGSPDDNKSSENANPSSPAKKKSTDGKSPDKKSVPGGKSQSPKMNK